VLGAPPAAAVAQARSAHLNGEGASEGTAAHADAGASLRRARQAARVSITRSLTERGLYFVRVLDEGQTPADDACEGLLVSSDPNVTLV